MTLCYMEGFINLRFREGQEQMSRRESRSFVHCFTVNKAEIKIYFSQWFKKSGKMTLCYLGGFINLRFKEDQKQMSRRESRRFVLFLQ